MHAQRADRARGKHEPIEIDRDLIGVEDGDERNRGETADDRGGRELKPDGSAGAGTTMAFGQMAMAAGTGRQRGEL